MKIPEVKEPIQLSDIGPVASDELAFVLDPFAVGANLRLDHSQESTKKVSFAIGPEGGWRDDEVKRLNEIGFQSVYLGERILRNETAVIATLSIIQHQLGQLA